MSLVAHLDVGRSDRVAVDRVGTLRDTERTPVDIMVDNLSTTGCMFLLDRELPLGALVSIGIPGVGVRYARISRVEHPQYGCAFLSPVSDADIAAALSVDTVIAGAFPQMPVPAMPMAASPLRRIAEEPSFEPKLPLRTRVAMMVGISAVLWTAIVVGVLAIVR